MPTRVHALIVVRPDGRTPAAHHLRRTLTAVAAQTRRADALTIVLCGDEQGCADAAAAVPDARVVSLPASTAFAAAVRAGSVDIEADAVWLLAQDTTPDGDALARLVAGLDLAPSVAFVAPKLIRAHDRSLLASLGVTMTRFGRAVELAAGDLDQGQHDGLEDVLGGDVRGLLVRMTAWERLDGLDDGLAGADEGLDLGVRARLAGARVALVAGATVAVSGDGVAGPADPTTSARRRRAVFASRVAQLHRRLVYARPWALPLHWLSILPLAVWRTAVHLVAKQPSQIGPEWAAAATALVRLPSVARRRRRIAGTRAASWAQLAPLRISAVELRERLGGGDVDERSVRSELRFFSGGGAWLMLGMLAVSVLAFPQLLAWNVLGGGGLQPLRPDVVQLWADTVFGARALGWETVGPADPFAVLVAIIGSLWPLEPSRALVILWVLALPLAALGGWFAATRVTERSGLRIAVGFVWALAPPFLVALTTGRPSAMVVHLLLPWLFFAGSVAHRSWSAAAAASLLLVAVLACAPSLAPALVVLWIIATVVAVGVAGRSVMRMVWVVVPAVVFAAPFVWRAFERGDGWWMLADPGVTWTASQSLPDAVGRAALAVGFPGPDFAGWTTLLSPDSVWWVPFLVAPVALLALVAPLTLRWAAGVVLIVVVALGLATAFVSVGIAVAFADATAVALWPGSALSLAWLGALGGAAVTLDVGLSPGMRAARALAAVVVVACAIVVAAPSLTALMRGTALLQSGPDSTLPAFVAAEGAQNPDVGTLVLRPLPDGGLAARVVWGGSETLGGQAAIVATRTSPSAGDAEAADIAAALVAGSADDVVARLAAHGVAFVLLAAPDSTESDAERAMRTSAASAIDQREQVDAVGQTTKGALWRVVPEVAPRASESAATAQVAGLIAGGQIGVVVIALLLAVPTAASRREAHRSPRVVGPHWGEAVR
jgi:GT2 family glycosyltransferase